VGVVIGLAIVAVIVAAETVLADPGGWFSGGDNPWPYNSPGGAPVLAAVGDISCQPGGNHEFYDNHGQTGVRGLGYFDYYNGLQHSADGSEIDDTVTNPTTGVVVKQPAPQRL